MELKRKWLLVIGVLFLTLAGTNAFAANVAITTSDTAVLNQSFDADLVITGTDTVGAFDLTVTFDPSKVQITGITPGTGFSAPAQTMIDAANTAGTGGTLALSYLDVTMAGFTPAAEGTTAFTLSLTPSALDAQSITPGGTLTQAGFPPADVTGNLTPLNFTAVDKLPVTVTASVDPAEGGGISNPGDKQWFEGDTPTYTITVNDGYQISSVLVDGEDKLAELVGNDYTFLALTAPGPHTIKVTFDKVYTVTSTLVPTEGGVIESSTSSDTHVEGTKPTYTVTVNDGFAIKSFMVDDVDQTAALVGSAYTYSDGISDDSEIVVNFARLYTVNLTVTPDGAATVASDTGSDVHEAETTPTYTVTPAEGYRIDAFTVSTNPAAVLTDNAYKLAPIGANVDMGVTLIKTYTVTTEVTGEGTVTSSTGTDVHDENTTPTYTVAAGDNYRITSLAVDGAPVDIADPYTVEYTFDAMAADALIAVEFQPDAHAITPVAGDGGKIATVTDLEVVDGLIMVPHGTDAELKAKADEGYYVSKIKVGDDAVFKYTEGDAYSAKEKFTLTNVTAPMTVEATFERIPVNLVIDVMPEGRAEVTPESGAVDYGSTVTVAITPNAAWLLAGVEAKTTNADGEEVVLDLDLVELDGVTSFELANITANVYVDVNLERDPDYSSADLDGNYEINLSELLRVIQIFTVEDGNYHCYDADVDVDDLGEDGFAPGLNAELQTCTQANMDYEEDYWVINLSELLRIIQFFTLDGYRLDVNNVDPTLDGFAAGKVE